MSQDKLAGIRKRIEEVKTSAAMLDGKLESARIRLSEIYTSIKELDIDPDELETVIADMQQRRDDLAEEVKAKTQALSALVDKINL